MFLVTFGVFSEHKTSASEVYEKRRLQKTALHRIQS